MHVVCYELKKIFYHQKGWLYVLLFLAFKIVSLTLFNMPENIEMQNEISVFSHYLDKVQGKITEQINEYMTEEADSLSQADASLQNLNNNYYDGIIDRQEYEDQLKLLQKKLVNEKGFDVIFKQYEYARENPENRYILYTNGWGGLLSQEKLDWLFYILLFLLITPIFCEEIGSNMDIMILTQKNGGRYTANFKILISVFIAVLLSVFNSCIEYIFFLNKYGLKNGTFPLQSLSYFMNCEKEISLYGAFLGISCLKIFGAVCLTIITLFLSVSIKRYSFILLINTSIIMLPFYAFSIQSIKYCIPGPLSFLIATGFFRGDEYKTDKYTNQLKLVFQEISYSRLILIMLIVIGICAGMIYRISKKNTNIWYKKKITSQIK